MRINVHDGFQFAVFTLCVGWTLSVRATGFRLPDQDAFATGRGEAFVATADNPSAIYYNPAGISQLEGNNLRAGVYGIDLDPQFQPPGGAPNAGQTYDNQLKYHAIPQFYYTYTPKDWIASFGLGVYTPFGLGVIWPQDTGFNTVATEGKLFSDTINPVVSFKLLPSLSFGGGIMVNYAQIKLQQGIAPIPPAASGASMFSFDGDGWNVGFNLGALWQPIQQLSFGATVRSGTTMNFKGQTETILPPFYPNTSPNFSSANSKWSFPLDVAGGVSYRPTEKWNLEFDADYTDWGTLGTVNLNQSTPPFFMGSTTPIPLNWSSSWYFEWGATRYLDHGWHVNAGYIFNQNSVPNPNYTPFVADMNRHFLSVGLGRKGKNLDFDIAYQFGYGPNHTVSGSTVDLAGQSANGTYSFISHAISASVGWHF
ncbi:MAG TPA: outer membrane protein transport protein [Candidatus Acidoferrales bacterium]|nr:outer membrane protein transport protein [Candidatus Acidoferrales bacterium]